MSKIGTRERQPAGAPNAAAGAANRLDAPQGVNPCPAGRRSRRLDIHGNPGDPAPFDPHEPRPGGCRYIHGDPHDPAWHYCQRDAVRGTSWCREHYHAVFQPIDATRDPVTRRILRRRRRALGLAEAAS